MTHSKKFTRAALFTLKGRSNSSVHQQTNKKVRALHTKEYY